MLLLTMFSACAPAVVGLEESDVTAPMEWHSRIPECEDGAIRADLGAKWQFVQVFRYDSVNDRWSSFDGWRIEDNAVVISPCRADDPDSTRVAWVNLP